MPSNRATKSSNEKIPRITTILTDTHDNIIHERAKERRDWRLGGVEELCSITVDQVFVKSGRLVGHRRRAKPSGSLVRAAGWWSRGSRRVWWRGGGGWRVEGRWLEAAAVSRRWKSTGIRFPLSFTILDRSDQTGSGKILFSSSGGEKTLVSRRIVAPERNPLSFSDPGMILTGWGGEWNRPRPRIDPRRGRLSLSLSPREGRRPCVIGVSSWKDQPARLLLLLYRRIVPRLIRPTCSCLSSPFYLVERAAGGVLSRTGLAWAPGVERAGRASPPLRVGLPPPGRCLLSCLSISPSPSPSSF